VVFTTPAVRALKRHFPHSRLTYLVEGLASVIVRHEPALDDVIVAERPRGLERVRYDLALARRLRAARFDVAIDFHGGPRSAWLTWASGAPRRIGYAIPGRQWMYTDRVPWSHDLVPPRHSVLNQWDLLRPLGIGPPDPADHPVAMAEDPDARERVRARLASAQVAPGASLVVVHVSAGNPFRRWPAASFAAVAAALAADRPERRIIITSGPSDSEAAAEVARAARSLAGPLGDRIVRCGEFDLAELRSLAEKAALFIGGDSGPLHIATTSPVPIVAIFGPTLPERSKPWRDPRWRFAAVEAGPLPCRPCHQRHCVPGDFRCLTGIGPARVIEEARRILG
jgi:ADP-heptose:LPS heptosyltransferase